jgi:hypothetical protein
MFAKPNTVFGAITPKCLNRIAKTKTKNKTATTKSENMRNTL